MSKSKTIREAIRRKYPAVQYEDNLGIAIETMAKTDASALVVKNGDELIGIITITDIITSLAGDSDIKNTAISSIMTKCDLITEEATANPCAQLDVDQPAMSAVKVMQSAGVNHLIVSGEKGEPVGIVSSLDLVKLLAA